jgi:hexosaminidase
LTLFADVCTPDASDAIDFNQAVTNFLSNKSVENQAAVVSYLNKWIKMDSDLNVLSKNAPLVQPLLVLSKSLNDISQKLLLKIDKKENIDAATLNNLLEKCNSKANADVELAVYKSLKKLVQA